MSCKAQELGAAAVIVILPYYQKPSKPAVIRHFRDLRAAIDLPVMLYNNPANSACVDLSPREIAQLVEEDVLHMVKSTYETVVPVHDLKYLVGDRMAIFYGSFQAAFEAFCAGAHGWISGVLNVAPKAAKQMYDAVVKENDAARGFRIWKRILPLVHLYTHQLVGPVSDLATYRSILNFWGLQGGYSRNPYYPLDAGQESRLRAHLEKTHWLNPERALDIL
jgi:4-hydroxy-tetrahydrodipicolinate synthase